MVASPGHAAVCRNCLSMCRYWRTESDHCNDDAPSCTAGLNYDPMTNLCADSASGDSCLQLVFARVCVLTRHYSLRLEQLHPSFCLSLRSAQGPHDATDNARAYHTWAAGSATSTTSSTNPKEVRQPCHLRQPTSSFTLPAPTCAKGGTGTSMYSRRCYPSHCI